MCILGVYFPLVWKKTCYGCSVVWKNVLCWNVYWSLAKEDLLIAYHYMMMPQFWRSFLQKPVCKPSRLYHKYSMSLIRLGTRKYVYSLSCWHCYLSKFLRYVCYPLTSVTIVIIRTTSTFLNTRRRWRGGQCPPPPRFNTMPLCEDFATLSLMEKVSIVKKQNFGVNLQCRQ